MNRGFKLPDRLRNIQPDYRIPYEQSKTWDGLSYQKIIEILQYNADLSGKNIIHNLDGIEVMCRPGGCSFSEIIRYADSLFIRSLMSK
jgi:hypothetical protein